MNLKRLGILVTVAAVLAVMTTGNASADTAWPGTHKDVSSFTSGSASYSDFITDRLYISVNDYGTWTNKLTVNGGTGYYPEAAWALTDGSDENQGFVYSTVLYSNGNTWTGNGRQHITRAGSYYQNGVCHWYETSPHGDGPRTDTRGMPYTAS